MIKSSKKEHKHTDLGKVPKKDNAKKRKLNNIREKETFREMLTDEVEDIED